MTTLAFGTALDVEGLPSASEAEPVPRAAGFRQPHLPWHLSRRGDSRPSLRSDSGEHRVDQAVEVEYWQCAGKQAAAGARHQPQFATWPAPTRSDPTSTWTR
ncbi:hypothetical protein GCM10009661_66700 [Catellatospora chokoriensis]|uniref:Uncharacterized protein n=1 Tax=Catellatospora chokoriensis TaxID=310353 RepID=A0A8J3NS33_9ACTN|nr:hypothetical protein Cch02nite_40840 [Catellatospora chokoriensis]